MLVEGKVYLLVTVPLALDLPQNVDSVVVPQRARHLVVVHGKMVLLDAPQLGQSRRIDNFEHARIPILPRNVTGVPLGGVVQQLLEEVPE